MQVHNGPKVSLSTSKPDLKLSNFGNLDRINFSVLKSMRSLQIVNNFIFVALDLLLLRCHNVKNGKEASEVTEKNPAGCAGEGKQSKGNIGEEENGLFRQ